MADPVSNSSRSNMSIQSNDLLVNNNKKNNNPTTNQLNTNKDNIANPHLQHSKKENTLEHHINDIANQHFFDDENYYKYNYNQHLRDQSKIKQPRVDYDKKEIGEKHTEPKEPNSIIKFAYACGRGIVKVCKWFAGLFGWKPKTPPEGTPHTGKLPAPPENMHKQSPTQDPLSAQNPQSNNPLHNEPSTSHSFSVFEYSISNLTKEIDDTTFLSNDSDLISSEVPHTANVNTTNTTDTTENDVDNNQELASTKQHDNTEDQAPNTQEAPTFDEHTLDHNDTSTKNDDSDNQSHLVDKEIVIFDRDTSHTESIQDHKTYINDFENVSHSGQTTRKSSLSSTETSEEYITDDETSPPPGNEEDALQSTKNNQRKSVENLIDSDNNTPEIKNHRRNAMQINKRPPKKGRRTSFYFGDPGYLQHKTLNTAQNMRTLKLLCDGHLTFKETASIVDQINNNKIELTDEQKHYVFKSDGFTDLCGKIIDYYVELQKDYNSNGRFPDDPRYDLADSAILGRQHVELASWTNTIQEIQNTIKEQQQG